ncbi:MAG: hypothetical protein WEB28_06975 [Nitrosopumilaceae archaeon]
MESSDTSNDDYSYVERGLNWLAEDNQDGLLCYVPSKRYATNARTPMKISSIIAISASNQ